MYYSCLNNIKQCPAVLWNYWALSSCSGTFNHITWSSLVGGLLWNYNIMFKFPSFYNYFKDLLSMLAWPFKFKVLVWAWKPKQYPLQGLFRSFRTYHTFICFQGLTSSESNWPEVHERWGKEDGTYWLWLNVGFGFAENKDILEPFSIPSHLYRW